MGVPKTTLVCGPPCSGKSKYVLQRQSPSDLVIDIEGILRALAFVERKGFIAEGPFAGCDRNTVLDRVASLSDRPRTWIIDYGAQLKRRQAIASRFKADVVLLNPGREACLNRAAGQLDPVGAAIAIEEWYREFSR